MRISTFDAAILLGYLLATLVLGVWLGRTRDRRTTADYFLGSRQLPWWALLLSIVATETSTVTFLSVPGIAFRPEGNYSFLQFAFGLVIGRVIVTWVLLPLYFRRELFTSYELLERRLGASTRRLASLLFLATRTVGDALRLFLVALVLHNVVHLDMTLCILTVGTVTLIYTLFGGLRSVVWNDCIQFIVYIAGAVVSLLVILRRVPDGWRGLYDHAIQHDKLTWFVWRPDDAAEYSFAVGTIGGAFLTLATHGTDHLIVQRLLSSRSQRDAARALILSGIVVFFQFALFLTIGVALSYFYTAYPPSETFASHDEVFASFIVDHVPLGFVGVILASVFAAAMSTQSSSLNSSASAAINDFYRPILKPHASESHLLAASKTATLVFGVLQISVAIAAQELAHQRSVIDNVLSIAAFAFGPVLGLFFLAARDAQLSARAAFVGFTLGLGTLICLKILPLTTHVTWSVHGLWYTVIGSLVTFLMGTLANATLRTNGPAA